MSGERFGDRYAVEDELPGEGVLLLATIGSGSGGAQPRRILLSHQVYVRTVEALLAEPGVTEVLVVAVRPPWVSVSKPYAATTAALVTES